jgi:hypothetical protein
MKRRGLVWLLLAGIITVAFLGCVTKPKNSVVVEVKTEELPPNYPLTPITSEIISLATKQKTNLRDFQYYISTILVLEPKVDDERIGNFVISNGEGLFMETVRQNQIEIFPGTKGILNEQTNTNGEITIIEICFDEKDKSKSLTFQKNMRGDRFNLVYDKATQSINYGGQRYQLRMFDNGNVPYLLIRYSETIAGNSSVRKLGGRSL